MKDLKPETFLEAQELSALETGKVKGGMAEAHVEVDKKKDKTK